MNKLNDRFERHGYWEIYRLNGNLWFKGNYFNGQEIGYWEWHWINGNLTDLVEKEFYL